jgi:2-polyprenyl-6-methoxyphenol hydroxylase-like FAD-dependent oxidoreductase
VGSIAERAVVVGGSVAGLLAAGVLAEAVDEVVLVERDPWPEGPVHRRGVPQGRQPHLLLGRGREELEGLFPGFGADVVAAGGHEWDLQGDGRYVSEAGLMAHRPSGMVGVAASRPLLESVLRRRVTALHGVCPLAPATAEPVLSGDRVAGVRVRRRTGEERELAAAVVVDATGRGSHQPAWLERQGYGRPPEVSLPLGLSYTSWTFPRERGDLDGAAVCIVSASPDLPRGGSATAIEGDRWLVTASGYHGASAPRDLAGFRAFLDRLVSPEIGRLIAGREPLEPAPVVHRLPASVRRHYEWMPRRPEGLLVVGDAYASFNPVYGQGMTVAALEATALRADLALGLDGLADRSARSTARAASPAWDMAAAGDLRLSAPTGRRPLRTRVLDAWLGRVVRAATTDPQVAEAFLRTVNLMAPPSSLLSPAVAVRVLRAGRSAPAVTPPAADRRRRSVGLLRSTGG